MDEIFLIVLMFVLFLNDLWWLVVTRDDLWCLLVECVAEGEEYEGKRDITKSGLRCQSWNTQIPHSHRYFDVSRFPDQTLQEAENFCRNPDKRADGPWCYTTDPNTETESCGVVHCTGPGKYYNSWYYITDYISKLVSIRAFDILCLDCQAKYMLEHLILG